MDERSIVKSFVEAFDSNADVMSFVGLVDDANPYGMDFSDLFHSQRASRALGGFRGKKVLEIGGALPPKYLFDWLKCRHWTSVEYHAYDGNQAFENGADKESESFSDCGYTDVGWKKFYTDWRFYCSPKFDLIYSIAAFEHIDDLGSCLDSCYEMLVDGGILYSYFTPIWSAPNGSHGFHPPELDVLGGHSHLMFDFVHLQEFLLSKGCDTSYARNCAERLFRSSQINRYTYEEFVSIFNSVPFRQKRVIPIGLQPLRDLYEPEKLSAISRFYPGMSHSCAGFEVVMIK